MLLRIGYIYVALTGLRWPLTLFLVGRYTFPLIARKIAGLAKGEIARQEKWCFIPKPARSSVYENSEIGRLILES
jgi:hypothetical protein